MDLINIAQNRLFIHKKKAIVAYGQAVAVHIYVNQQALLSISILTLFNASGAGGAGGPEGRVDGERRDADRPSTGKLSPSTTYALSSIKILSTRSDKRTSTVHCTINMLC